MEAIGNAWQRAKERQWAKNKGDQVDDVYHYMNLSKNRNGTLPMVWKLQEIDDEFQPGAWFVEQKLVRGCFQGTFNKIVGLVENQVEGFAWLCWQQVDGQSRM